MIVKKYVILITIIIPLITSAQTHAIFLDDTVLYHKDSGIYWLNDSLPDGRWTLYDVYRKDSMSIKNLNDHVLLSEAFNGGLRQGKSYIYKYSYNKRRPSLYLLFTIDYQNGKIEGEFVEYQSNGVPAYEWSVSNNQLNGLCVTYDMKPKNHGKVVTISFFENDSLIRWNDYKNGYKLVGKGTRLKNGYIEYSIFENNTLKYKYYFKNYHLIRYYEYTNSQAKEIVCDGPFYPVNMGVLVSGVIYPDSEHEWIYMFHCIKSHQK